ncbi:hypothetical protein [Acidimangrovimonas pyrenivorans]|uniref:VWFA domain-containing protein n=1 Tax=Acidimangrovimonas pyrenivorans TaxID=2030798 RepID=A0ABV7ABN4_9RHOB
MLVFDILTGTVKDDILVGDISNDSISGDGGDDIIIGSEGFDNLLGEAGDDLIAGDADADTIEGGDGDDIISGGTGSDVIFGDNLGAGGGSSTPVTTSNTTTIPATSQDFSVSLTAPDSSADTAYTISGFVSTAAVTNQNVNVSVVVDTSGSTSSTYSGTPVGDLNGDGYSDTVLDGEIAGVLALVDSMINDAKLPDANVQLARFDSTASTVFSGRVDQDANNDGVLDIVAAAKALSYGGSTYYDYGLQESISFFGGAPAGQNYVWFMSDGVPSSYSYDDEVQTLIDPTGIDAKITAIGVGSGASENPLDLLDDGIDNDSAEIVTDPGALSASILGSGIDAADVDRVEIWLDGSLIQTIASTALVQTPLGLRYEVDLTGLDPDAEERIVVRAYASDTASTMVSTAQTVEVLAADGDDVIFGNEGSDMIFGQGGSDFINGGGASDLIYGGSGNDTIIGADGHDTINGGANADRIYGGTGDDQLVGDLGYDTIWGGLGDDTIYGGDHGDWLRGGDGADALFGGGGIDWADYRGAATGVTVAMLAPNINTGEATGDTLVKVENIRGTDFDDDLRGDSVRNVLMGLAGNDKLVGNDGNDLLQGNAGADALYGGKHADRLEGGLGADHLYGNLGADVLVGGAGNDVMDGGLGIDTFVFFAGTGNGADTIENFVAVDDTIRIFLGTLDPSSVSVTNDGTDTTITYGAGGANTILLDNVALLAGDITFDLV